MDDLRIFAVTVEQAARMLHVSKPTVYRLIEDGVLPVVKQPRGKWLITVEALQGYLSLHERREQPPVLGFLTLAS